MTKGRFRGVDKGLVTKVVKGSTRSLGNVDKGYDQDPELPEFEEGLGPGWGRDGTEPAPPVVVTLPDGQHLELPLYARTELGDGTVIAEPVGLEVWVPASACEPISGQDYTEVPTERPGRTPVWKLEHPVDQEVDGGLVVVHRGDCTAPRGIARPASTAQARRAVADRATRARCADHLHPDRSALAERCRHRPASSRLPRQLCRFPHGHVGWPASPHVRRGVGMLRRADPPHTRKHTLRIPPVPAAGRGAALETGPPARPVLSESAERAGGRHLTP